MRIHRTHVNAPPIEPAIFITKHYSLFVIHSYSFTASITLSVAPDALLTYSPAF